MLTLCCASGFVVHFFPTGQGNIIGNPILLKHAPQCPESARLIEQIFRDAGIDPQKPVVTTCGSGVTAATNVLALALAGYEAALYAGSWSSWSNTPGRLVATGAQP